jgi:hypothetical protein
MRAWLPVLVCCGLLASCGGAPPTAGITTDAIPEATSITWNIDSLETIGGHPVEVLGDPQLIHTTDGPAVEFDGVGDALFLPVHPLAAAKTFTWEVIFRPDSGGGAEQRFFHLQVEGVEDRLLFETRLVEGGWYLDAYASSGEFIPLVVPEKLYALDQWFHIAQTYDGTTYHAYVNGELQDSAELALRPQGPGRTSIGVRINLVDYFKGAIRQARFTARALTPAEFLPTP